jgi:hypothetical protein
MAQKLSSVGSEASTIMGSRRRGGALLRFPFVQVLYRQEAGDEAYYDDVPVSLSPFQNWADFDQ